MKNNSVNQADTILENGVSDCCDAPIKEIGGKITVLVCSKCDWICNQKIGVEDIPEEDLLGL